MDKSQFIKNYHNPNSLYINQENKWLWLRIHKTAGTSIYDAFLYQYCINIAKPKQRNKVEQWLQEINNESLNQYTIWTCVRNPYDRFHSMAAMFKKDPNDFIKNFHKLQKENSVIYRHTQPQHIYTHHEGERVVDTIILFEDLQFHFAMLCIDLNLPEFTLPKLNATKHAHWSEVFSPETIQFVNNQFALDFKYFNYQMIQP